MLPHCAVAVAKATQSLFARCKIALAHLAVASLIGAFGGCASAFFLGSLNWAGTTRLAHDWLIFLLPLAGLAVGLLYHHFGQPIAGGTSLVLDAVHVPDGEVPSRMAPMIYAGSVSAHVVGASVGREGAIVQIVASITDDVARRLRMPHSSRRVFLVSAIAAAFGGLFGVPFGGAIFALEAQRRTRLHVNAILPALIAGTLANAAARGLGATHETAHHIASVAYDWSHLWRYVVAGACFGLVAMLFIRFEHTVKSAFARLVSRPPLRPFLGGFVVLLLVVLADSRVYLGLSTGLVTTALAGGTGLVAVAFLWKIAFTGVSLGSGFVGGEVFPLFVIGALTGVQFARVTNGSVTLFAALGLIAVFAGAADTPLACIVIGVELFGWAGVPAYAIVCLVAMAVSTGHTIYKPSPLLIRHTAADTTN